MKYLLVFMDLLLDSWMDGLPLLDRRWVAISSYDSKEIFEFKLDGALPLLSKWVEVAIHFKIGRWMPVAIPSWIRRWAAIPI